MLILVANKSTGGIKLKALTILLVTVLSRDHSVLWFWFLDSKSASWFKMPGMCSAEIMFPLSKHQCQISDAMMLHSRDLLPPLALIYDTEQVLSHLTLICFPLTSLHNDLRPKRIAFSSRTLMCIVFSSLLQLPPVLQSALTAPHACKLLSVVINT